MVKKQIPLKHFLLGLILNCTLVRNSPQQPPICFISLNSNDVNFKGFLNKVSNFVAIVFFIYNNNKKRLYYVARVLYGRYISGGRKRYSMTGCRDHDAAHFLSFESATEIYDHFGECAEKLLRNRENVPWNFSKY